MTIRSDSPSITLPDSPSRRSVADLIKLWESRAGVGDSRSTPVVESGSSTVAFTPKAESPEARDNSLFVRPTAVRPVPSLKPSSALSERTKVPSLELPKPTAHDSMMLSVASNAPVASPDPSLVPTVEAVPAASAAVAKVESEAVVSPHGAVASGTTTKPLQSAAGAVSAVSEPDGLQGALASAQEGKMATALSQLTRHAVTAPFQTMSALLDGPRKIGDTASSKGHALVQQGDAQGGLTGAVKVAGGALAQALGASAWRCV